MKSEAFFKRTHLAMRSPYQKWLTALTAIGLPAGKVYLSPVIDCFDGMVHSWTIGTSPNAQLVNNMLEKALATLRPGEHPIIHSDWECHYRWPEWIKLSLGGMSPLEFKQTHGLI